MKSDRHGQVQKYLEVKPEQVRGAVATLSMLSHVGEANDWGCVGSPELEDQSRVELKPKPRLDSTP